MTTLGTTSNSHNLNSSPKDQIPNLTANNNNNKIHSWPHSSQSNWLNLNQGTIPKTDQWNFSNQGL